MTQTVSFGRRETPPDLQADPDADPRLEALRREAAALDRPPEGFAAWRNGERPRRLVMWMASLALTVTGVVGLAVDAPLPVSAAAGVGGLALGAWLKAERKRHLHAIAAWSEDAPI